MKRSLRRQLVAIGLVASLVPLLALVLVVFGVEEDVSIDSEGEDVVAIVSETGVSPWIPIAASLLAVAAVAGVYGLARRAVDPIERMTRLADEIQAGSLDRRLALDDAPDEIRDLGESFDRMLDRLADASALERRLIEDASHELRTPLAALSARLDVAARHADDAVVLEDLAACEADVLRMQETLEALLSSARSRQNELEQVDNDLVGIIERVVSQQRLVSPDVPIEVISPESLLVGVDGPSLERAVANLLTNAVVHGGGAPVAIEIQPVGAGARIVVVDEGPGIEPSQLPLVFDRYAGGGSGLGLALVKQVADAHGAVEIESPVDGRRGTRVTLDLIR